MMPTILSDRLLVKQRESRREWRPAIPGGCARARFAEGCAPITARVSRRLEFQPDMPAPHPLTPLLAPSSVAIFGASNDPTRISGRSLRYYREAGYQGGALPDQPDARHGAGSAGPIPISPRCRARSSARSSRCRPISRSRRWRPASSRASRRSSCSPPGLPRSAPRAGSCRSASPQIAREQRDPAVRPQLPRPLQHADRPYPDLQLVSRGGADPGGAARHGDAIGRVRDASPGADGAPRHLGRGVASTGNEADVSVADGISFLADDPDTTAIACYVEAIKDGAAFAEAVGAGPRQRQAGHRDEGRRLDGRRRRGGFAHRFPGRQRRGL